MDEKAKIKIKYEISRIEKLLDDVKPLLDLCRLKEPDIIEISAAAQVLHSFYNGIESIIVLFFKNISESIPSDYKWHKTLFEMTFGNNSKKISIIRNDLKIKLEEYLLFRHFIRHSYSSELNWNQMKPLVNGLDEIWKTIKTDFEFFMNKKL